MWLQAAKVAGICSYLHQYPFACIKLRCWRDMSKPSA